MDNRIPKLSIVEIEVNSLCNRRCSYCPVSILPIPNAPRQMALELFHKIINELGEMGYAGILSYMFYSEPLLRKDLDQLVRFAAQKVPKAFQLLFTNGDLLDDKRYQQLVDAGIHHFLVTRHANTPIPTRKRQTVQYPSDLKLTNRGGVLFEKLPEPLALPCYSPTDNLVITSSGEVVLCCNDPKRSEIMGDVTTQSIKEVWFSEKFTRIRELLQRGDRAGSAAICAGCDDREALTPGGNHYKHLRDQVDDDERQAPPVVAPEPSGLPAQS